MIILTIKIEELRKSKIVPFHPFRNDLLLFFFYESALCEDIVFNREISFFTIIFPTKDVLTRSIVFLPAFFQTFRFPLLYAGRNMFINIILEACFPTRHALIPAYTITVSNTFIFLHLTCIIIITHQTVFRTTITFQTTRE